MIDEESAQASLIASKLAYSYGAISESFAGYLWVREFADPGTGFHAQVFKNNANEYIVAFTGTGEAKKRGHSRFLSSLTHS